MHLLVTLVLIVWTPWCVCRWAPTNCCVDAHDAHDAHDEHAQQWDKAEATLESKTSSDACCGACCQQKTATEKHDAAPSGDGGCKSACCAPRLQIGDGMPNVPCDMVGTLLPDPIVIVMECAATPWTTTFSATRPPGDDGGGREILLRSSILRT